MLVALSARIPSARWRARRFGRVGEAAGERRSSVAIGSVGCSACCAAVPEVLVRSWAEGGRARQATMYEKECWCRVSAGQKGTRIPLGKRPRRAPCSGRVRQPPVAAFS